MRSAETAFSYGREVQPRPKLGRWMEDLDRLLARNADAPARERMTLIRIFEELRALGYGGGYDAIRDMRGAGKDLAHCVARQLQVARDLPDRLALNEMLAPYPTDRLHNQHPPPPASRQSSRSHSAFRAASASTMPTNSCRRSSQGSSRTQLIHPAPFRAPLARRRRGRNVGCGGSRSARRAGGSGG